MENKNQIPKNLEKGMRVKAVCMGKLVGDYIVGRVDEGKAYLYVIGDEEKRLSKIVSSRIDPCNRVVECLGGNTIQCTEYYYEADFTPCENRREVEELRAYIDELEYEIEALRERLQKQQKLNKHKKSKDELLKALDEERLHREQLINKAALAVTEEEREKYHNEITDCESVIQSLKEDLKMCD